MAYFARHAAWIDTTPLRNIMTMIVLAAIGMVERSDDPKIIRKIGVIIREIKKLSREILVTEMFNCRLSLKAAMLANPAWKARVQEQLGGYWKLKRWAERYRHHASASSPKTSETNCKSRPIIRASHKDRPRPGHAKMKAKTGNLFCLAPLSRVSLPRPVTSTHVRHISCERAATFGHFKPIPLHPDEIAMREINVDEADTDEPVLEEIDATQLAMLTNNDSFYPSRHAGSQQQSSASPDPPLV